MNAAIQPHKGNSQLALPKAASLGNAKIEQWQQQKRLQQQMEDLKIKLQVCAAPSKLQRDSACSQLL